MLRIVDDDATELEDRARELVELADELAAEAQELGRQWEELGELVAAALADDETAAGEAAGEPDSIRLVALEMKLTGYDRGAVLAHLRRAFGDTAAEPALDRAVDEVFAGRFGPPSPA